MARQKSKKSLLSSQKTRRIAKIWKQLWRWKLVMIPVILIAVAAPLLFRSKDRLVGQIRTRPTSEANIKIQRMDGAPISTEFEKQITALVKSNLVGPNGGLTASDAVAAVQRKFALSKVHLIKTGADQFVLSFAQHNPVLVLFGDRPRFVTEAGLVFGEPTPDQVNGYPRISGFDWTREAPSRDDSSLDLPEDEQRLVNEAVQAWLAAKGEGLQIVEVQVNRYRGMTVRLSGDSTEISLGRAPYQDKVRRLKTILGDLAKKGSQAKRIELDYEGKAFVKEEKL